MKVANTYWDNAGSIHITADPRRRTRTRAAAQTRSNATPQWFVFSIIVSLGFLLCLVANIRAFSEYRAEVQQSQQLAIEIESLTSSNLGLQTEVKNLQTDAQTIEREARTLLGMVRPNERIILSYK
jgi:cell division protein FtsB